MTTKDELYKKAKKDFDVKLDRRMTLSQLQDQMARLTKERDNPTPEKKEPKPVRVRNIVTGNEFSYDPIWKGNPDLQVIEWEE
jgi:hypothetical protein